MSIHGIIDKMMAQAAEKDETRLVISVGRVMDTNDPNQMGRIRVYIPSLDRNTLLVGDLPFAIYCSPFAGHQQVQSRGPNTQTFTTGPVAYGLFSVPKVGTDVVVAHFDGNPQYRVWFGSLQGMYLTHTLPHGRFMFNNPASPGELDGPLSSTESPIQPQYDNLTGAYTRTSAVAENDGATSTKPRVNFEWRTRGMDYQAAGLGASELTAPDQTISATADDRGYSFTEEDGKPFKNGNFTQGYAQSRVEPNVPADPALIDGGVNYDPQVYSLTTPGFHAWSMDDRPENCRMRLRTSTGHTIILDDTNERIYIATSEGNNWVEMDQDGSIDVYSARRVSIHAAMDVNIKTEGAFRVDAAKGVHIKSGGDTRITTAGNAELLTSGDTNIESQGDVGIESSGDMNVFVGSTLNLTSGSDTNINTGGLGAWTAEASLNLSTGGLLLATALDVFLNGPAAVPAAQASPTTAKEAFLNNRVPEHEPWGRIMMEQSATDGDAANTYQLEFNYDSPEVGRVELGQTIPRNSNWHR